LNEFSLKKKTVMFGDDDLGLGEFAGQVLLGTLHDHVEQQQQHPNADNVLGGLGFPMDMFDAPPPLQIPPPSIAPNGHLSSVSMSNQISHQSDQLLFPSIIKDVSFAQSDEYALLDADENTPTSHSSFNWASWEQSSKASLPAILKELKNIIQAAIPSSRREQLVEIDFEADFHQAALFVRRIADDCLNEVSLFASIIVLTTFGQNLMRTVQHSAVLALLDQFSFVFEPSKRLQITSFKQPCMFTSLEQQGCKDVVSFLRYRSQQLSLSMAERDAILTMADLLESMKTSENVFEASFEPPTVIPNLDVFPCIPNVKSPPTRHFTTNVMKVSASHFNQHSHCFQRAKRKLIKQGSGLDSDIQDKTVTLSLETVESTSVAVADSEDMLKMLMKAHVGLMLIDVGFSNSESLAVDTLAEVLLDELSQIGKILVQDDISSALSSLASRSGVNEHELGMGFIQFCKDDFTLFDAVDEQDNSHDQNKRRKVE
jgi:hypothetical protein